MKILSLAVDASGIVHLAMIRAPDLWRRDIAAQTGGADLVFVALPPAGVSVDVVLARLETRLAGAGAAPARMTRFANTPTRVYDADPARVARWLCLELERASRQPNMLVRLARHVRRGIRRRSRAIIAAASGLPERGLFGISATGRRVAPRSARSLKSAP